jgi:hypothetical protein
VFQSFDLDSSGCLSRVEFHKALELLAPELTSEAIDNLFDKNDAGLSKFGDYRVLNIDDQGNVLPSNDTGNNSKDGIIKVWCGYRYFAHTILCQGNNTWITLHLAADCSSRAEWYFNTWVQMSLEERCKLARDFLTTLEAATKDK